MELTRYAAILWRWRALLVVAPLVAGAFGYSHSSQSPPVYRASTTLIVGQFLFTPNPGPSDLAISEQLAQSYVQLVRHQPLLQATVDSLGLPISTETLADRVAASHVVGTPLLDVTVTDSDPMQATNIANDLARQLVAYAPASLGAQEQQYRDFARAQLIALQTKIEEAEGQISDLQNDVNQRPTSSEAQAEQMRIDALQGRLTGWRSNYASLLEFFRSADPANSVRVLESAAVPTQPVAPRPLVDLAVAALAGFIVACLAAILLEYLDLTVKTIDDVQHLNQRALGSIARLPKRARASDLLVSAGDPLAPFAEAFRVVATNLQFASLAVRGSPLRRLVVTSAASCEGKTLVAANLAITLAQSGKRVILCDTDLRRPALHRLFGVANRAGLTSLLLDESVSAEAVLVDTPVHGLKLMPSGPLPPNPAELLGSEVMQRRLSALAQMADVVICDSPAVLGLSDTPVLTSASDGVVLVVRSGQTRTDLVQRVVATLQHVDANLLGVVLNASAPSNAPIYYSYARAPRADGRHRWRISAALAGLFGLNR